MFDAHFILLHVESPAASAAFYADLLGKEPLELSPTFAMFALDGGMMLGIWRADGVAPPATPPGGAELAFTVGDDDTVRATHADWLARGLDVLQPPTEMDFGYSFTARDPDGHRLRVFAPAR